VIAVDQIVDRIASIDWAAMEAPLDAQGFAVLPAVLAPGECAALQMLYEDDARFRSRIEMARYRFGIGEYKYFADPLPPIVQALREALYERLAPVANRWRERLKPAGSVRLEPDTPPDPDVYPPALGEFLARCHRMGQNRPTPLLLSYAAGGYNCLHQDIYGDVAFPLQAVFVLSRAGVDYSGGELLLVEQRPRAQSRGHAVTVSQGAGIVFATRERPAAGTRGAYRVVMRHGVSTVTRGSRMSLGIIFHDAA
jgi:hypothetical protein